MKIPAKAWVNYVNGLNRINKAATDKVGEYLNSHPLRGTEDMRGLIDYAYSISTKYGEAAAALACEMYDAIGAGSGEILQPAEPAPTPRYGEVAKTVQGTAKYNNPKLVSNAVGRLVKRTAADTTLNNAERDGAQFAWIPHGDTCSFCIALASRGWQYMSKDARKNGHAEHIHANCDCEYAIRFDKKTNYEGYDPDKYLDMYESAEGKSSQDKINSMRRKYYEENKNRINALKRDAYENKRIRKALDSIESEDVTNIYIENAKPGIGIKTKENEFRDVDGEESMANWIFDTFGGDIIMLADNNDDGEYNPDYLWNGKLWDLKTPRTESEVTLEKRIRHGINQIEINTGGVILDFSKSKLSLPDGIILTDKYGRKRAKKTTDFLLKKNAKYVVIRVKK